MRDPHRRLAVSLAAAAILTIWAAPASGQWVSAPSSAGTPRGQISSPGYVYLALGALGLGTAMTFAAADALENKQAITRGAGIGVAVGGFVAGGIGTLIIVTHDEPDAVAFAGTVVLGLAWSVAGVGIGAATQSNPRAAWLGGSMALGTFAVARMGMAFGGVNDHVGASWGQFTLGMLGGAGCFADAIAVGGRERAFAATCAGASFVIGLAGVLMTLRPEPPPRPLREPEKAARLVPRPWVTRDGGGVALAGVF